MFVEAKRLITTRLLPKTGQTHSYHDYDDGTYQAGWWKSRKIADNKTRFIAKTIGGDDVVIDLATGLMWPKDYDEGGWFAGVSYTWVAAIDLCYNLDFAGFTDWRMPNIKELASIVRADRKQPAIDPIFTNMGSSVLLWSSTTRYALSTNALTISTGEGLGQFTYKAGAARVGAVRGGV